MSKTYSAVKAGIRGDIVPEYLKHITERELFNYFFNWHVNTELALVADILLWYKEKRGWEIVED
jgi:hypothetical protein